MASVEGMPRRAHTSTLMIANVMLQIGKRIGFGKRMVGAIIERMFSPEMKARAFAGYTPTEHDVFVATFGKSGTNWMMQIAQQIAHRGAAEFPHIHAVVPWPDGPGGNAVGDLMDPTPAATSPTGLRVIKTHLETEYVPYGEQAIYLTVIRDPKEVLVSSYYFLGGIFGVLDHVTIDDWFDLMIRPGGLMEGWAVHTASYWNWRERPNVLVLNYREIIKEPEASIELVARTMGVTLSAEQFDNVVERSSFAYMQAHEAQFAPPKMPFTRERDRPKMIRRGKTGDSEEALSVEQQIQVDELCQAGLERLNSAFPYRDAFDLAVG